MCQIECCANVVYVRDPIFVVTNVNVSRMFGFTAYSNASSPAKTKTAMVL
jgi:hypothetical protein